MMKGKQQALQALKLKVVELFSMIPIILNPFVESKKLKLLSQLFLVMKIYLQKRHNLLSNLLALLNH
jgi:hypothetical protein